MRQNLSLGVSYKGILKSVSSTTETSWKTEISPVASLRMILFKKRITKALIRLRGCTGRAYPGSEFVVANTLAKWEKLEPNEINFNQGFSQKVVSTSCFVFNSLPARGTFGCLLITFANRLDPDQARQNVRPDLDPSCLTFGWY